MFAMALDPVSGLDVGKLLDDTLRELGITHTEAWLTCDMKAPSWTRALQGEKGYPLDLWKFSRLPWPVQAKFWSKYIAAQAERFSTTVRSERLVMAKAELSRTDERKVS